MLGRERFRNHTSEALRKKNEKRAKHANSAIFRHRTVISLESVTASTATVLVGNTIYEGFSGEPKAAIVSGIFTAITTGGTILFDRLRRDLKKDRRRQAEFNAEIEDIISDN